MVSTPPSRDTKQVARVELSSMDVDHVVSLHEAIPGLDEVDWWITLGGVDTYWKVRPAPPVWCHEPGRFSVASHRQRYS
jgi:hypothetical protein